MKNQSELLQQPIALLPLSEELISLLSLRGYINLQDILQQKLSHLRNNDGLTLQNEVELFDLVKEYGLEKMWWEE